MPKTSVRGPARDAIRADAKARKQAVQIHEGISIGGATLDSFVNFAQKMGVGADNPMSTATYAYNPISRNRNLLEWIHRGSWLGGQVIDVMANDMTRAGADIVDEMDPGDVSIVQKAVTDLAVWDKLNECIKWGRLYGGAIAVALIDGQDPKTPLNPDSIGEDQFKGLCVLDRWMLEPTLEDLITDYGPDMGLPKYYRVMPNAPALRGAVIHYSRIVLRHVGNELPYQQALTENLWGCSTIERLYDRMIAFDGASTGMGQLIYKAYLRTFKVKDLRTVIATGGKALEGLIRYTDQLRRYQNVEGLSLIDADDELEVQTHGAMSGMSDALMQLGQQLSGATGIPLVRLFGQSPAGLNSTGESDLRMYYDNINQQQMKLMHRGVKTTIGLVSRSKGVTLPDDFSISFRSLWQLKDEEKANIAKTTGEAVGAAVDGGLIGHQTALKELRQSSRITGIFSNITQDAIDSADDEVMPPAAEAQAGMEHEQGLQEGQQQHELNVTKTTQRHDLNKTKLQQRHELNKTKMQQKHEADLADQERKHGGALADKNRQSTEKLTTAKLKQEAKNAKEAARSKSVGSSTKR